MKRTFIYAKHLAVFTGLIYCELAGFYYGLTIELNIIRFWGWLSLVVGFFALLGKPEHLLQTYRDGKHLPEWVDILCYMTMTVIAAGAAQFMFASFFMLLMSADLSCRRTAMSTKVKE